MEVSELFDGFLDNLKVNHRAEITTRRDEIPKVLNKEFRPLEGSTGNQLLAERNEFAVWCSDRPRVILGY